MNRTLKLIFLFVILNSCDKPSNETSTVVNQVKKEPIAEKLDYKEIPLQLLALHTSPKTEITEASVEANLFGKFLCDRAEFYVIEKPLNKMYSSRVHSITLFYLDGELKKTKYLLKSDITLQLIKKLGNFTIAGFDEKNHEIISSGESLIKTRGLNSKLDNYQLIWRFENYELLYRVDKNRMYGAFKFFEKVKNYDKEFREIERFCR